MNAELFHREGANATMVDLLTKAASLETISNNDIAQITQERRRIVSDLSSG
jgi:hypothetical protein